MQLIIKECISKSNGNLVYYLSCQAVIRIAFSPVAVCLKALVLGSKVLVSTLALGIEG